MVDSTELVVIEADGTLRASGTALARRLGRRFGRYTVVGETPGLMILRRAESKEKPSAKVLMAGELVNGTSVLEIVNMIANSHWRGELHFFDGECRRSLAIDQGALIAAWSNNPDDRLGQVLYREGILSRAQLDDIVSAIDPEHRFGQVAIDKGYITQEALYGHLRHQVEHIFYASLLTRDGSYAFSLMDDDALPPATNVHLPIQALLMEGVRRMDEMALFRERVPSDDLVPEPQSSVTSITLDANARTVVTYATGERTIEDIARESGLGLFDTVKSIYHLVQRGAMVLRTPHSVDDMAVQRMVEAFNQILRHVFVRVGEHGGDGQTRATLEAWIGGSGYGSIFGEQLLADGSVDAGLVVSAMKGIEIPDPMGGLHQALHELVAFGLFAATTTLPREAEITLSREVNQRLKHIRT